MNMLIYTKAKRYKPSRLPDDIEEGDIGDCFDHCLLQAVKSCGKYQYCEGMALVGGKWIHHAWLTDREKIYAYDPTWKMIVPEGVPIPGYVIYYVGAVLNLDLVTEFVIKTGYKSPIANADKDRDLAHKIYESAK
jgi:hypothetical protein